MHRNIYWMIFLSLITASAILYTGNTLYKIYQYYRLSDQVPAQRIQWSVHSFSDEAFSPKAHYQFAIQGTTYEGNTIWDERYLNAWTAQEEIKHLSQQFWQVWVDPSDPTYSALQKKFPFKQSVSTAFLWFLWLYFISLGRYVKRYS